jgi:hypothetical protein
MSTEQAGRTCPLELEGPAHNNISVSRFGHFEMFDDKSLWLSGFEALECSVSLTLQFPAA